MMKGGLGGIMKQVQQAQANMQKAQEELAQLEVTGEAGAGMVKIVMTGKHEVRRVTIDDTIYQDDKEMVEDLIAAAINDAVHKVEKETQEKFSGIAGGMNLPAGFKMPF